MHKREFVNNDARALRISLLRLNASREGLNVFVRSLTNDLIAPKPHGEASQKLQFYISKIVPRCFKVPHQFNDSDLLQIAHQTENASLPGERHIILDKLKFEIDIRRQTLENASRNLKKREQLMQGENPIYQEIIMGDKYESGQVGAQGPHAHAHDMTFNQVWSQAKHEIDLLVLAKELNALRSEMQKTAKDAEDFAEIGIIANAEIEAQNSAGAKTLSVLSKAGNWTLKVAEKIGVGVATAAIKTAYGI